MSTNGIIPRERLSEQQQHSLGKLMAFATNRVNLFHTLAGYAGTGKTTLIQHMAHDLAAELKIAFTAPTNKAVRVMQCMADAHGLEVDCLTTYSLLGLRLKNDRPERIVGKDGKSKLPQYQLVVVDECSMVNEALHEYIMADAHEHQVPVVFVGDPAQLPPVKESDSPTFDHEGGSTLTDIVRQAEGNPIIRATGAIRHSIETGAPLRIETGSGENGTIGVHHVTGNMWQEWMRSAFTLENIEDPDRFRVVAWRNKLVGHYNAKVREWLYGVPWNAAFGEGERILAGERASVVELVSGEEKILATDQEAMIYNVASLDEHPAHPEDGVPVLEVMVRKDDGDEMMLYTPHPRAKSQFDNVMRELAGRCKLDRSDDRNLPWFVYWQRKNDYADLRPIHALTAHKSQGSTFENVFVDVADIMTNRNRTEALRCLYVACSRASHNLIVNAVTG